MDRPVGLIPLVCVKCSTPVPAEADEVAWACAQCGQGLLLDENQGLVPMDVFYSAALAPNAAGRPFWVAEGRVNVVRRATYSGNQEREAQAFWDLPRRFLIPAFNSSLEEFLSLGMDALRQPPDLQPGPPARFAPVTLWPEDIPAAAEFIVMAIEAGRKDKLREAIFSVDLSPPVLWILP